MKDKFWMVMAILGFCVIAVVTYLNYHGKNNYVYEAAGASYTPQERQDLVSSQALYQQLIGARQLTCPTESLPLSLSPINLNAIYGTRENSYEAQFFILNANTITEGASNNLHMDLSDWVAQLKLTDAASKGEAVSLGDITSADIFAVEEYPEIIAPFSFYFDNVNSDYKMKDSTSNEAIQTIIIKNVAGDCRITFSDVANWFCAGIPGTQSTKGTGVEGLCSWEDHWQAHHSVIGNSGNAVLKGGNGGYVIGYAKPSTTVKVEVLKGGTWVTISIRDLISTTD